MRPAPEAHIWDQRGQVVIVVLEVRRCFASRRTPLQRRFVGAYGYTPLCSTLDAATHLDLSRTMQGHGIAVPLRGSSYGRITCTIDDFATVKVTRPLTSGAVPVTTS